MNTSKGVIKTTVAIASVIAAFVGLAPFAMASDNENPEPATGKAVAEAPVREEIKVSKATEASDDLDKVVAPAPLKARSSASQRRSANAIDTTSREAVRKAYVEQYLGNDRQVLTSMGSDYSKCKEGTVNPEAADMVMNAWNFFRGLNNMDAVTTDPASPLSHYMQKAALTQAAYNKSGKGAGLSHTPNPNVYPCADADAQQGSFHANLSESIGQTPSEQIQWWMQDWSGTGSDQYPASSMTRDAINDKLGHRNWLMDPYITESAYGNVAGYSALAVANGGGYTDYAGDRQVNPDAVAPETMSWPSAGYFPAELLTSVDPHSTAPADKKDVERWSFRVKGADMSNASATVRGPQGDVPVRVVKTGMAHAPSTINGYGTVLIKMQPNSMVLPKGEETVTYTVTVRGVKNAAKSTYTYQVKLFNAEAAPAKPQIVVSRAPIALEGSTSLPARVHVVGADATLQWQISKDKGATWTDAPRISNIDSRAGQPTEKNWSPGLGECKASKYSQKYNTCPITPDQAENLRFRLKATNSYGTSYSKAMQVIFLGFKHQLPTEVKAGETIDANFGFRGNGDWVDPYDIVWTSPNMYTIYSTSPQLKTTQAMAGKKVVVTARVRIGDKSRVTFAAMKSDVITVK